MGIYFCYVYSAANDTLALQRIPSNDMAVGAQVSNVDSYDLVCRVILVLEVRSLLLDEC